MPSVRTISDKIRGFIRSSWQRSTIGKEVYFEDTGEKLGIVFDAVRGRDGEVVGYNIKDENSEAMMDFPVERFEENARGLIFRPLWYTEAKELISQLEFQPSIIPELTEMVLDGDMSKESLYEVMAHSHPNLKRFVDEAITLREVLRIKLEALEISGLGLRNEVGELAEKRLLGENKRRDFARALLALRRKTRIVNISIKRCRELLLRLDRSPFVPKEGLHGTTELRGSALPAQAMCPFYGLSEHLESMCPFAEEVIEKEREEVEKEEAKAEVPMKRCFACDATLDAEATGCDVCGVELAEGREKIVCSLCGFAPPLEAKECPQCGARFIEEEEPKKLPSEKEKYKG
ncbi:MAG: zinc ribbon domain-containing protein [Methanomassiliicoccales archaeon]|nr:MAG: zinc ribbon domain-containing protein [Methanomassiliicoccales archaeon]